VDAVVAAVIALLLGVGLGWIVARSRRGAAVPTPDPVDSAGSVGADDDGAVPEYVDDVLSVLPSSGIVLDRKTNVVACSPSAVSHGLVRGTAITYPALLTLARRAQSEGGVMQEQLALPRGPGVDARRVVSARAARLGDEHVLLLVEDRSHAYLVEEVRRDFLANVSHELKTPVGGILLLAEAVKGARDDPEAVARFAKRMRKEARRLDHLVTDIVQLSRLQSEDRLSDPVEVDLARVVNEAVDDVRVAAEEKEIDLVIVSDKRCWVWGDRGLLVTAVRNLVVNAVAYSGSGTRVAIRARVAPMVPERSSSPTRASASRSTSSTGSSSGSTGSTSALAGDRRHRPRPGHRQARVRQPRRRVHGLERAGRGSTFTLRLPRPVVHARRDRQPTPSMSVEVLATPTRRGAV
jgi:two-component system sensor histidine kinase SenX3